MNQSSSDGARFAGLVVLLGSSLAATIAGAAELRTADAGAPFCTEVAALHPYVQARANRNQDAIAQFGNCRMLGGGLKVDVSRDIPGLGGKIHLLQVGVHEGGSLSLGYLYGNALVVR